MRTLVVWCPDWSVTAAAAELGLPATAPAAVFSANRTVAVNQPAREQGVRRQMRRRDAQMRCPGLHIIGHDEDRDARGFETVLAALEKLRPAVLPLRPGLAALRSPARFYGGDLEAGAVLAEQVVAAGVRDVRIGIADDLFTAEQAARRAGVQETVVVEDAGQFLRPLPMEVLGSHHSHLQVEADTVSLLHRLGLHTLGDLVQIRATDVASRFGAEVAAVRRSVIGGIHDQITGRTPPPELVAEVGFETGLTSAETVCFSSRRTAESFVAALAARQQVCTELVIEVTGESGETSRRAWLHPRFFASADIIDRLHWQLAGVLSRGDLHSSVATVRFLPQEVAAESVHADGLWGGTDARVERGIARVQGLLGPEAVLAPVLQGGRSPADRQAFVPWGNRPTGLRPTGLPWPGSVPPPAPARVLATPVPAGVLDEQGQPLMVLDRGQMSGVPARYRPTPGQPWRQVTGWAGPWPVVELWWEAPEVARNLTRFQLITDDGRAWLVAFDTAHLDAGGWLTEAAYE